MTVCVCMKISKLCSLPKFVLCGVLLTILSMLAVRLIWFIPFVSPGFCPATQVLPPHNRPLIGPIILYE